MPDKCTLCDGPLTGPPANEVFPKNSIPGSSISNKPFHGPFRCGYCLALFVERLEWQQALSNLLKNCVDGTANLEEIKKLLIEHHFTIHELATRLLEWHFHFRGRFNTLNALRSLSMPLIESALDAISECGVHQELLDLLSGNPSEADLSRFLSKYEYLLRTAVRCYNPGDSALCAREFRLGSEYVTDFLILYPRRSLPPSIVLVELEPSNERPFTHKGTPGQRLLGAIRQIREWHQWIRMNREYFNSTLLRHFSARTDPTYLRQGLWSDEIDLESFIFIGRREKLKETDFRPLWKDHDHRLSVHTYDTFST